MSLTFDDKAVLAGVERFLQAQIEGLEEGLAEACSTVQDAMQTNPAHGDQSGATHASYRAFVIGGSHDGSSEASSGYAAAQSALAGFTGHQGQALREDSGVTLGEGERGVLMTSFTDYQDKLEDSDKAVLGPTLQQYHDFFTQKAAEGARSKT